MLILLVLHFRFSKFLWIWLFHSMYEEVETLTYVTYSIPIAYILIDSFLIWELMFRIHNQVAREDTDQRHLPSL